MINLKFMGAAALLALLPLSNSCQLNETLKGTIPGGASSGSTPNTAALLTGVYIAMRNPFQGATNVFALSEVSTDERIMPTRAGDWDDNGVWRELHLQNWTADNTQILGTFNGLNGVVFSGTDILQYSPTTQQAAEARFLRAYAMYWELDLFDQVPYRDPAEDVTKLARVRKGTDALNYIISEVQAVLPNLPDVINQTTFSTSTKDAARGLLMKCFLNKGVYANRVAPTFDPADMNQVITLADQIINSGRYKFAANYFDNFCPNNGILGTENIHTEINVGGTSSGPMRDTWLFVSHYNMNPSGYNGPCASSDLYNLFEPQDLRRGQVYRYAGGPTNPSNKVNVGLLTGQQYSLTSLKKKGGDSLLFDRRGNPLAFTSAVNIIEPGNNLEVTGIRPIKYPPDFPNSSSALTDNDMVHLRLPDVLLMKAEAILRGGTATSAGSYGSTPLALVNSIRTNPSRGASALASVDLTALLAERSRELYMESWRRQDMIRFGTFLKPFQAKASTSDPKYLIYPIPNQQLAVNSNLTQNPGY